MINLQALPPVLGVLELLWQCGRLSPEQGGGKQEECGQDPQL